MPSPAGILRLFSTTPPTPHPNSIPKTLRPLINSIFAAKDPNTLVSLFNSASSSDPHLRLHPRIYSSAVSRLLSFGSPTAIQTLIEYQKSHPEFTNSEPFASRLILLYGKAGLLDDALATFKSLRCPRTVLSMNSLLTSYAKAGYDPETIKNLIREVQEGFPEIEPNVVSYNIVVNLLCEKEEFGKAMEVVELMERKEVWPNLITYNTLLHGFYSSGRFEEGEKIWEKMERRDVRSYNARLRGLCLENRVDDLVSVIEEMEKVGLKPDVYSYNALIKGYCQNGMLEQALKVYSDLGKVKCEPDTVTFKTLVSAFWDAKDLDVLVRLCNESVNKSCFLEESVLQGVVDKLAKQEMYLKAKRLVKHVRLKTFYGSKCLRMPLPCIAL